jgi:transposase-like protein
MSQRKERRNYSAQEKIAILRRHLIEKEAVSDLCERYQLQPTVFYRWQQELFANGAAALERRRGRNGSAGRTGRAEEQKIARLEARLQQKNEVLAELMEEHVKLKKTLGAL